MQAATSKSPLLLDISRLVWRARRRGPTGIDRVELAYAQRFLAATRTERPAYGVVHLFGLLFALSPAGSRRFVEALSQRWQGSADPPARRRLALIKLYLGLAHTLSWAGPWLKWRLRDHARAPIFLVVSHHHLARDYTIARVRRSFGARAVCLIHDLIPLDYPEYFECGCERRYQRLARTVARHFDAVIANSAATAHSLHARLAADSERCAVETAIRVAPLGVRSFAVGHRAALPARPYFVVLGTIEPRKNHLLLLNLWTRIAALLASPPRLLVIGTRGWENEQVVDMLERSHRLRGLVEERSAVADGELGELLGDARALLLPSFAEGFGLPVGEALASGTPVICSDIAPFREVGRDVPEYLEPLDAAAWGEAIMDYCRPDSPRRRAQLQRLAHWRAPRWEEHFGTVERLLDGLQSRDDAMPAPGERPSPLLHQTRA